MTWTPSTPAEWRAYHTQRHWHRQNTRLLVMEKAGYVWKWEQTGADEEGCGAVFAAARFSSGAIAQEVEA